MRKGEKCGNCEFWLEVVPTATIMRDMVKNFECHRYPPTPMSTGDYRWPKTKEDDWCGQWKKRASQTVTPKETKKGSKITVETPRR